jgi:hypothetical protein
VIGGRLLLAFAYQDWAQENLVRAFVVAWAGVVLVWLVLDWLGNPNRGRFRPQGPRRGKGIQGRVWAWRDQRDHRDAEIRETLRAAYGKSSLRLSWSKLDETAATAHDESRLSPIPQLLEIGAPPMTTPPTLETEVVDIPWDDDVIDLTDTPAIADLELTKILWDADDTIDLTDQPTTDDTIDLTDQPTTDDTIDLTDQPTTQDVGSEGNGRVIAPPRTMAVVRVRWQTGDHPLAPTLAGSVPTRTTVRSRAWKNEALAGHGVGGENRRRMTKGRPPRRWNPLTGEWETANIAVDDETFAVKWATTGVDPYGHTLDYDTNAPVS